MNPWLFPWMGMFKSPFNGDNMQQIFPFTKMLPPQVDINFAGDAKIEAKIISDIASYGKQLNILLNAVQEIADGNQGKAIQQLKSLIAQINQAKLDHDELLQQTLKIDIERLNKQNPNALRKLIDTYHIPTEAVSKSIE